MSKEKVQAEHSTGISSIQLSVQPKWRINMRLFVFMWNILKSILLYFVNPMTEIKSCSQLIAISYNVAVLKVSSNHVDQKCSLLILRGILS